MELRNKGTVQNVTIIKSNVCLWYNCITNIYVQLQMVIDFYASIIYVVKGGGRGDNTQVGKIWSFLLFRLHDLEFQVIPFEEQFTDMNKVTVRIRHVFDCSSSL